MRKLSWILLALLIWTGCDDEIIKEEKKPKTVSETESIETEPPLPDKITWDKDGSKMVLIPAGRFKMGDSKNEPEPRMRDARPVHQVELDAFYMDTYEVSVEQYKKFLAETGHRQPDWNTVHEYSPTDEHPIVFVSWNDTVAYANWAGKRLPTEAEWEYAARGGLVGKRYPWGDGEDVARDHANYNGVGGKDKWKYCSPVGSFEANGHGLYDMAGNVYEWCADGYSKGYYKNSPAKNPPGPNIDSSRLLRGGSWTNDTSLLRVASRNHNIPTNKNRLNGFRCCVSGSDNP